MKMKMLKKKLLCLAIAAVMTAWLRQGAQRGGRHG